MASCGNKFLISLTSIFVFGLSLQFERCGKYFRDGGRPFVAAAGLVTHLARAVCQQRRQAYFAWIGEGPTSDFANLEHDIRVGGITQRMRFTIWRRQMFSCLPPAGIHTHLFAWRRQRWKNQRECAAYHGNNRTDYYGHALKSKL
jgi:hypothetical protein